MNSQPPPPQLPTGWVAMWDQSSQRYYYLEQATGKTQWEVPGNAKNGESNNYGYQRSDNQTAAYSTQQQQSYNVADSSSENHKGMGKVFAGVGGVVAGGLIGLAAGKLFSHHESHKEANSHQEGHNYSSEHNQQRHGKQGLDHGGFDERREQNDFGRHGNQGGFGGHGEQGRHGDQGGFGGRGEYGEHAGPGRHGIPGGHGNHHGF